MENAFGLLMTIAVQLAWIIPGWKILARIGLPPAIALIAVVPLLGVVIVMAIIAYLRWPRFDTAAGA